MRWFKDKRKSSLSLKRNSSTGKAFFKSIKHCLNPTRATSNVTHRSRVRQCRRRNRRYGRIGATRPRNFRRRTRCRWTRNGSEAAESLHASANKRGGAAKRNQTGRWAATRIRSPTQSIAAYGREQDGGSRLHGNRVGRFWLLEGF